MTRPELPPRQVRFVEEYLVDLNATQAAIRAGYSARTADVQGPRLLGNVRIKAAIAAAQKVRSARTTVTQDRVVEELWNVAALSMHRLRDGRLAMKVKALEILAKHLGMFKEVGDIGRPLSADVVVRKVIFGGRYKP